MGKEWHFGGRSSRRATVDHHRHHHPSFPGCMSTLFRFFDFHFSHFTPFVFNQHRRPSSFDLSHPPPLPKTLHHGVEAPRKSLELDEASISCLRKDKENLQIQMGLQIKTSRNGSKKSKASEQQLPNIDHIASDSPSAKTPNLLARLMGLDILPQTSSRRQPKPGVCYHISGTCSLPESPRVSSSRLSDDVDHYHHRLSLQINLEKENTDVRKEIKRGEEKVRRRKVALVDVTNSNKKLEYGKNEVGFCRNKVDKSSKRFKKIVVDKSSSKARKEETTISKKREKSISMPMSMLKTKLKKAKPRDEEAFGCPTNNNNLLDNLNCPTNHFPVKKELSPSAAKIPHEQPCSYPKGKQKPPAGDGGERNAVSITGTTDGGAAEFRYIKRILTAHGISTDSPISSPNWFSPSNPLDPSMFHHLETTGGAAAVEEPTRHRWNRRLLFDLVDEVLGEIILKKSWHVRRRTMKGWELAEEVRERVEEFPRANCQVLEDIDALIDKDLGKWKSLEIEGIVKVVELHILESLLRETTAVIVPVPNGVVF